MTHEIEKLFTPLKHEALLPHERNAMREELKLFMREHPARVPLSVRAWERFVAITSSTAILRYHPAALASVLVLCVGVGTSYAAEGALPGDTLYPVKIHVNESLQVALAVSDESKARASAMHAVRRLEEAETLAAEGRLTASASAEIESRLRDSAEEFDDHIIALADSEDSSATVIDVQSSFEAVLTAHVEVMSAIAMTSSSSEDTLAPIRATAEARAKDAKKMRARAERVIANRSVDEVRVAASAKKSEAKDALQAARALTMRASGTLGAVSAEGASTSASQTEKTITAGEKHFEDGEYGKALNTFQAAIRRAEGTKVNVSVREHLKEHVTLPALKAATSVSFDADIATESDEDESSDDVE